MFLTLFLLVAILIFSTNTQNAYSEFQRISSNSGGLSQVTTAQDQFGFGLCAVDLNADGRQELIVGSFNDQLSTGSFYTLFLTANGTVESFVKTPNLRTNGFSILGLGSLFGAGLAPLPDILPTSAGNGVPDLVVTAPGRFHLDTPFVSGSIFLLSMSNTGAVVSTSGLFGSNEFVEITPGNIGGLPAFGALGLSAQGLGDLDNDGNTDLAIGGGGSTVNYLVFVFLSGTNQVAMRTIVDGTTMLGDGSVLGVEASDQFGASMAVLGDLDQDGTVDIAVGAPGDDDGGTDRGALYILFLQANAQVPIARAQKISDIQGSFLGSLNSDGRFGFSIGLAELNNDGVPDILAGAVFDNDGGTQTGAVWVIFLARAGTALSYQKISGLSGSFAEALSADDEFGSAVVSLGDLNGDNITDFAAGSRGFNDGAASNTGAVYVFFPARTCGNAVVDGQESCDDGNLLQNDGCSAACQVELGFTCTGIPSVCSTICGDTILTPVEQCDDGNTEPGDGCDNDCQIELGFACGICEPVCGDNILTVQEECDDGNRFSNDGCSSTCSLETRALDNSAIIGIAVGAAACLCCVLVLIAVVLVAAQRLRKTVVLPADLSDKIPILQEIKIGDTIGFGNFGKVYKGTWNNTDVALKTLKSDNMQEFYQELNLMIDFRHPNILTLLGLHIHDDVPMMVTEYMNRGDLIKVLHKDAELTENDLFEFSKQACAGMVYLHQQNVLHRDLAARNLLVSGTEGSFVLKIADFGLSRQSTEYYKSESAAVPVRWTAPEVIEFGKVTKSSDVWSYGVVLWEIFSRGGIPYAGLTNRQVSAKVKQGYRLSPPTNTPQAVADVMSDCWVENPDERPLFPQISEVLQGIQPEAIQRASGVLLPAKKAASFRLATANNNNNNLYTKSNNYYNNNHIPSTENNTKNQRNAPPPNFNSYNNNVSIYN